MQHKNLVDEALSFDRDSYNEAEAAKTLRDFYENHVKDRDPRELTEMRYINMPAEFRDLIELELFRKLNKNVSNMRTNEHWDERKQREAEFISGLVDHPSVPKRNKYFYSEELKHLNGMTPELLEQSEKIVDDIGITVQTNVTEKEKAELRARRESTYGHYGIPMSAKKVVIISGDKKITVNNENIQESFRAPYYNKLVQMSGIDIDLGPGMAEFRKEQAIARQSSEKNISGNINMDEYEEY